MQATHCTPGHCIYPYHPSDEIFEILPEDSEGMKQAKRVWNASDHPCHPNYMDGKEQYWIIRTYRKEHEYLTKLWEEKARQQPGIFSTYYLQIKQAKREGDEALEALNRKRSITSRFVEEYPNASTAVIASGVAAFALFFFVSVGPELFVIGLALFGCAGYALKNYIENTFIPHMWIQNQIDTFLKEIRHLKIDQQSQPQDVREQ